MNFLTQQQVAQFRERFPDVKENESMAAHTYLKIGGPARLYLVALTVDQLVAAIECARVLEMPFTVIGGGSNLLVSDDGYHGVVLQTADRTTTVDERTVTAAAGAFTISVARTASEAGLVGFEWGVGVPGTIGGAVYGDAGCFGGEMRDVVVSVEAYDIRRGIRVTYANTDCRFGYRESRFKHEPLIILRTTLKLRTGSIAEAKLKMEDIASIRKESQPQGAFSAGCLFKNVEYSEESILEKLRREGDEVPPEMLAHKRIAAGWLIDKLGLKGMRVGKAQVSPVHGNFLVNLGGARAQDVLTLSSIVKMKVRDELGILMEDEVQYLGF